jgi:hypothetical protein
MTLKKPVKKLLLLTASIAIALTVCEVLVRLSGYRPRIIDPEMFQSHNDDLLPYELRPNYTGFYVGAAVHIQPDGTRLVIPQCSGKPVMILGDSVAFGQGLNDDETISSQLQDQVCGQYHIKNIAVPGYSSWNEYAAFRSFGETLDRLILIYVPNDMTYENNHLKLTGAEIADLSNSRIHRVLRTLYSHVFVSFLLADSLKRFRHHQSSLNTFDAERLAYSMIAVKQISELCRERHIKFSVAIYRDVWHYSQPLQSAQYEDAVTKSLAQLGIDSFVLKAHIENLKPNEARIHFNDPHPSKRAVGFIVSELKSHL